MDITCRSRSTPLQMEKKMENDMESYSRSLEGMYRGYIGILPLIMENQMAKKTTPEMGIGFIGLYNVCYRRL